MTSVHSSSLIGAQAYASQLRRQYGQEETARAATQEIRETNRAVGGRGRPAAAPDTPRKEAPQPAAASTAPADAAAGNPTVGEPSARENPPAQPLYSAARRESPDPNASLRRIRPGTHLNITV